MLLLKLQIDSVSLSSLISSSKALARMPLSHNHEIRYSVGAFNGKTTQKIICCGHFDSVLFLQISKRESGKKLTIYRKHGRSIHKKITCLGFKITSELYKLFSFANVNTKGTRLRIRQHGVVK